MTRIVCILLFCGGTTLSFGKLAPDLLEKLPPAAQRDVDFSRDIKPIFDASCIKCHGRGRAKGGFAIDNRETVLKGGDNGPVAIPGKGGESMIVEMVSGLDPDNVMPQKGSKLSPEQVGLLRKWIDQNLPWDPTVTFGRLPPKNLHPRKPELPEAAGVANPVDRFVYSYFESHQLKPADVVEDRVFARRAFLDVIGLLPTPAEIERFLNEASADKREKLIKELLGRNFDYAQHWLTFWNDALRNDYKGTGYIDGGRKQITSWLFSSLVTNKPYNQFVGELLNPKSEAEGFTKGIVWRGVVNASQTPQMQAAQNISQVFMGVNLKCASCHDSFINDWTLADSYGLASIYADGPLEMYKCDAPTGKKAAMRFLYPDLGNVESDVPKDQRLKKLAEIVTCEQNGRLTRTIVNRLWARLMGRGLVEPVDDMDAPAWNQDLLDWLAANLAENNYDLKHTIALILNSHAYQLPAIAVPENQPRDFVFKGPLIRRLSAEQFIDAVAELTGVWSRSAGAKPNFAALSGKALKADFSDEPAQPKWIWSHERAASKADPNTIYFRRFVDLSEKPEEATFIVSCDNSFKLYVNGKEAGSGKDHTKPSVIDVTKHLREGINLIAVAARNWPGAPDKPEDDQANPAGLWLYGHIRGPNPKNKDGDGEKQAPKVMDFGTDSTWLWMVDAPENWFKPDFAAAHWNRAAELGESDIAPWKLGSTLAESTANLDYFQRVRASLANNDALMTALGRPNREQVVTTRPSAATTLQALELTNGPTLAEELKSAGDEISRQEIEADHLVTKLYEKAFGRKPTDSELALSKEMVGSPVKSEGVEDLLWAMTMLPEFQLIY
ncbi:MAG TPA: DUF1549 domain-containing protein [Verrucomicrobiae bacterium]|jgi:mono/diheme cytochrome c family protein|nr:DUF1549 domain-containing protein [Verrucomicrobiae bacterium]